MDSRALSLHCSNVYMAEARRRRDSHPDFARTLVRWSRNARRRAAREPAQREMFA